MGKKKSLARREWRARPLRGPGSPPETPSHLHYLVTNPINLSADQADADIGGTIDSRFPGRQPTLPSPRRHLPSRLLCGAFDHISFKQLQSNI
ncbi:hypothetical protein EYF80_004960 [Liparis tanakae]|uniref:Uncharacterized protein n=1 Tax=Liparis tanakae TaxID=230148 RepID=A0A4Z2J3J3_9TELE|nr:hypothetical protein EYF80_004960 [Liparis tanakae]